MPPIYPTNLYIFEKQGSRSLDCAHPIKGKIIVLKNIDRKATSSVSERRRGADANAHRQTRITSRFDEYFRAQTFFPRSDARNREISISSFQKYIGLWDDSEAIDANY